MVVFAGMVEPRRLWLKCISDMLSGLQIAFIFCHQAISLREFIFIEIASSQIDPLSVMLNVYHMTDQGFNQFVPVEIKSCRCHSQLRAIGKCIQAQASSKMSQRNHCYAGLFPRRGASGTQG
jgi:hypothetical protein